MANTSTALALIFILAVGCGVWPKKKSDADEKVIGAPQSVNANPISGDGADEALDDGSSTGSSTSSGSTSTSGGSTSTSSGEGGVTPPSCDDVKAAAQLLYATITTQSKECSRNSDCQAFRPLTVGSMACPQPLPALAGDVALHASEWQRILDQAAQSCPALDSSCEGTHPNTPRCGMTLPRKCELLFLNN